MKTLSVSAAHQQAMDQGADCLLCPHYGAKRGPVLDEVKPKSKLIVIGAYPAESEIDSGKPMQGQVGRFMEDALREKKILRKDISIANDILCAYPGRDSDRWERRYKREGKKSPRACCSPRLKRSLEVSGAGTVLVLGKAALESVARIYGIRVGADKTKKKKKGEVTEFRAEDYGPGRLFPFGSIKSQRGHPYTLPDGKIMVATIMPSYALRDAVHMVHIIRDDIKRAAQIAKRGHRIKWKPPAANLEPSFQEMVDWLREARKNRRTIMLDIESAGVKRRSAIRCLGLGKYRDDGTRDIIVMPLLLYSGAFYWFEKEWKVVLRETQKTFKKCRLQGAYIQFDSSMLIRDEIILDRKQIIDDLCIAHRCTRENDTEHSVAFISSRASESPLWKFDQESKEAFFGEED